MYLLAVIVSSITMGVRGGFMFSNSLPLSLGVRGGSGAQYGR